MQYNNQLTARDLFCNPALAGVFPQFEPGEKIQSVYSFAQTEARVQRYLVAALNGVVTGDGEITVKGKHDTVLGYVRRLQPLIESFFNNMPKVAKAIRSNAKLYLPYATRRQLEDIKTTAGKVKAMQIVMDNFQYNADLGTPNSVKNESPEQFDRNRRAWEKKVGYRRLKKV